MKFLRLAGFFHEIEQAPGRIEMVSILARLLHESSAADIAHVICLAQGRLAPAYEGLEFNMSEKLVVRTLSEAANMPTRQVEAAYEESGDLGTAVENSFAAGEMLDVPVVFSDLLSIAHASGKGSVDTKINLLASLLRALSPLEVRYVVRFVLGRLRLGIGDPTVLEALARVYVSEHLSAIEGVSLALSAPYMPGGVLDSTALVADSQKLKKDCADDEEFEQVKALKEQYQLIRRAQDAARATLERAYNLCSDLGLIGSTLKQEGLPGIELIHISAGRPVRMALCERLPASRDIIEKIGRVAVEAKYDGLRLQIHRSGAHVEMFSRNLERMNDMFPELREAALALPAETFIIEGEAIAVNEATGEMLPFQQTVRRKRKHDVAAVAEALPLRFFCFELLLLGDEDYTTKPYTKRRERMEALVADNATIEPARLFYTEDPAEIDREFESYVETGLEGIVAKRPDSPYAAGARNFNWIKLKRSYRGELADSVDLCIVGYYHGRGSRAKFGVGALLAAVYDEQTDTFKTVSKIGTGFTDEEFRALKKAFEPIELPYRNFRVDSVMEPDVWVLPRYVLEVTADEITRSPSHTAGVTETEPVGYALRFPRAKRQHAHRDDAAADASLLQQNPEEVALDFLRLDKGPEEATTVAEIIRLSEQQKRVKLSS